MLESSVLRLRDYFAPIFIIFYYILHTHQMQGRWRKMVGRVKAKQIEKYFRSEGKKLRSNYAWLILHNIINILLLQYQLYQSSITHYHSNPPSSLMNQFSTQYGDNQCYSTFCGCETIRSPHDDSEQSVGPKLYIYFLVIIIIVMGSIKFSLKWFIYKDYYPLKEKSPTLCILMIFSITVQLLLYPLIYTMNYFTYMFVDPPPRWKFRAIQAGFEFSVYFIYLVRCLRISYAHETHTSRKRTLAFKLFERQEFLAASIMFMVLLKGVTAYYLNPCKLHNEANCYSFAFSYEIGAINEGIHSEERYFIIRSLLTGAFWQGILIYCLWLQKKINYRYSMKEELLKILAGSIATHASYIFSLGFTINQYSTLKSLCDISQAFPMTDLWKILNLLIALKVSIYNPLTQSRIYHVLLPTGPHYGFTKTMRNFLMEKQFLKVFSKYLQHLDQEEGTEYYTKLLKFWKSMVIVKIDSKKQDEEQKLQNIKSLITQVEDIFVQCPDLVTSLKSTISGIQQIQQIETEYAELRKIKFRQSINDKVDELEDIALEKLNKIYVEKYYYTESYHHLKEIMNDYKKVNLNLIMLNMALIVDSQNQFT